MPPTKLNTYLISMSPRAQGERAAHFVWNSGGPSRGVAFLFWGSYVESGEITVDDAQFCYMDGRGDEISVPITFEKQRLSDGNWVYYWEDADFKIPPAVSDHLPPRIRDEKQSARRFGIRYTLNGNSRKYLDIRIFVAPLSNWTQGQCAWWVWMYDGSKRAYLERYNQQWRTVLNNISHFESDAHRESLERRILDPDAYDLDD